MRVVAFADNDLGDAPLAVRLEAEPPAGGIPPYTYLWDLGDGSLPTNGNSLRHTYSFPGEFRASVIVRDAGGLVAQDYIDISVTSHLFDADEDPTPTPRK